MSHRPPSAPTRKRLRELNRHFYERIAGEFDESRNHPWPGWEALLAPVLAAPSRETLRVLDLGCGNGRFGAWLGQSTLRPVAYRGIDANAELIAAAARACHSLAGAELEQGDFLEDQAAIPEGPFDLVVLFGVLHHVPGFDARVELIRSALERVAISGHLALSLWRFGDHARFERRTLGDAELGEFGIDPRDLEAGDHLLRWGTHREIARYCHHFADDESERLLEQLPARPVLELESDGREGNLNRYYLLEPEPSRV